MGFSGRGSSPIRYSKNASASERNKAERCLTSGIRIDTLAPEIDEIDCRTFSRSLDAMMYQCSIYARLLPSLEQVCDQK